jgi:thymidylate kinase
MLISFSGLDGAGKSTLIQWMVMHLSERGVRATAFHMNDHIGVYAYARLLRDAMLRVLRAPGTPAADTAPAASSAASQTASRRKHIVLTAARRIERIIVWNGTVRSVLYPIDVLIFLFYRLWIEGVRRQVLVMDRYFYDTLVDLTVRRSPAVRFLQWITPVPGVAVLLDISPEESFARKGEYSVPYLRQRHAAYHQVLPRARSMLLVRNDDLAATQRVLTAALDGASRGNGRARRADRLPTTNTPATTE